MKFNIIIFLSLCLIGLAGCDEETISGSDTQQAAQTIGVSSPAENPISETVSEKPISGPWMQFRGCKMDSDCVVAIGVCGTPAAINKAKVTEFTNQVARMSQIVRCGPPPIYDRSKLWGSCQTGICVLNGFEG